MGGGKIGRIEDQLEQLRQLRTATGLSGSEVDRILRKALEDRSNLVVASAAKLAVIHSRGALIPGLIAAFERLLDDPAKTDPKCWGKTAVVKALAELDYSESPVFLRGMRHVQMEPTFGGREDSAVLLRSHATLAIVQCVDLDRDAKLRHLVDMLADSADPVRGEAVRAIEQMDGQEAALLLRLKAYGSDKSAQVTGQVFDSLLRLEGGRAVTFVAQFMTRDASNEEVRDEAALALGGARLPDAAKALMEAWRTTRSTEFRGTLLRALSASREETALAFLLHLVKTGISRDVAAALEALELHKDSPEIQERIEAARKRT